ncbi:MAG TPA: transcription-repair coupling factor [Bdellovibrionota bacterium]|nr:transcription-repair coupling factor [Bdellovibrionota bacterium]
MLNPLLSKRFDPSVPETWTGLTGSSPAFALASILAQGIRKMIVVSPTDEFLPRWIDDVAFFLNLFGGNEGIRLLPYPPRPTDLEPAQLSEPKLAQDRLSALYTLRTPDPPAAVFLSLQALAQKTLPLDHFERSKGKITQGQNLDRDSLIAQWIAAGYEQEPLVESPGTIAVRGGIVDIFPPHSDQPYRIEWLGDTVETIRKFDPATQRSLSRHDDMIWIPAREILLTPESAARAQRGLKELADERDLPRSARRPLEEAMSDRRFVEAMEPLWPLFYPTTSSFLEYAPVDCVWIALDPIGLRRERASLESAIVEAEKNLRSTEILACGPRDLFAPLEDVDRFLEKHVSLELSDVAIDTPDTRKGMTRFAFLSHDDLRHAIADRRKKTSPLTPVVEAVNTWRTWGFRTLFVTLNPTEAERLHALLSPYISDVQLAGNPSPAALEQAERHPIILVGQLSSGFSWDDGRLVILTDHDLFGDRKRSVAPEVRREDFFTSLAELAPGDPVVHLDHGVGLYRGLKRLNVAKTANDFLHLEYAGGDKLYVPVYRLNRIHKYVGADGGKPHLDRLGNASAWEKTRQKAKRAVEEMAQELIALYATRRIAAGHAVARPDEGYLSFEADFPYEETRDQLRAIEEVSADLETPKPMDRLICGDVGFGKTEVALRAAFRVAMDGKQAAVLVPTTILAQQHYETFRSRLSNYPVRVDYLSRFKSARAQKQVVAQLADGGLDVVIGTHRLLSKDVSFQNLGLLIIDEEHRFGVKHKEKIKQFRNKIDVLTLTATPIPRTLQLSLSGIRDLSVINTPPLDRKAIHTYLCRFDDGLIRGAIHQELERGGQVFFVHNRVQTIEAMKNYLARIVPKARIAVAHGQMSERRLEETMLRLFHHEFDVLLCTTIIESGLDVPNANTILINRADHMGLAQLYQLRGRVGRSDRPASAYLLIPGEELISQDAHKRLKVLKRFTELGSGLKVALHDLEIRGSGNLLGASQSGHIAAVGFELYTDLLEREVKRLKGEAVVEEVDPEIHCALPAFLPDDYVADTGERLVLYKRLSSIRSSEKMESLRAELTDRFGPLPPPAENLFRVIDLKLLALQYGISVLRLTGDRPSIEFSNRAAPHLDRILQLIRKDRRLSLRPDHRLVIELRPGAEPVEETKRILLALGT